MNKQDKWRLSMLAVSLVLGLMPLAYAQKDMQPQTMQPTGKEEPGGKSKAQNMSDLKFGPIPGLPTCLSGAVEAGNPMTGPGFVLAKLKTGCKIPWHWHTAGENVLVVSGKGRIDMVDAKSKVLTAAGFVSLPSHHIHQFTCKSKCTLLIHTDAAFDIHYTDKDGNEIPAGQALKPFKEKPAPAPKM
ncbi:MAG TPA: cupin domain-containing protein [Gallionellaceae bacterium]